MKKQKDLINTLIETSSVTDESLHMQFGREVELCR